MLILSASDSRPLYQQLVDQIERQVLAGTWRAGDALPSVRQLAVELRINPNTVKQAYRELERLGIAYVRRGQGTYVSSRDLDSERISRLEAVSKAFVAECSQLGFSIDDAISSVYAAAEHSWLK